MNKLEYEIPGNTPQKADAFHKNKKKRIKTLHFASGFQMWRPNIVINFTWPAAELTLD